MNRAAPEESRYGPINNSDAEIAGLVPVPSFEIYRAFPAPPTWPERHPLLLACPHGAVPASPRSPTLERCLRWRVPGRLAGSSGQRARTWACSVRQPGAWRTIDSCALPSTTSSGTALQCWQANASIGCQSPVVGHDARTRTRSRRGNRDSSQRTRSIAARTSGSNPSARRAWASSSSISSGRSDCRDGSRAPVTRSAAGSRTDLPRPPGPINYSDVD
jgi:hypothetical protein